MAAFAQMTCTFVGFVLIFLTTGVVVEEFPGVVKLENCYNAFIDTPKNGNITLVCTGFNPNDTVVWSLKRTDSTMFMEVARCYPSNCTVSQPEPFNVERSNSSSHSKLIFQQNNTSLDRDVEVECKSTLGNRDKSDICKYNVIDTLPKKPEENRLPTEVIVGIVLGAVAGIILAVVVIRIVIVKLRRQEPLEENEDVPNAYASNGDAGAHVYDEIKPAKKGKVAEPETESAAKPTQSSMVMDETQRGAADVVEYNTLSHTRGAGHTQGQADRAVESPYDHI